MLENLAVKLCLLLPEKAHSAEQWKLLGQERDGSLLVGWTEEIIEDGVSTSYTVIGHYDRINDKLQVLHQFSEVLNIVQATINQSKTVLGYVIKQKVSTDNNVESEEEKDQSMSTEIEMYEAYIIELKGKEVKIHNLDAKRSKQVRIQFLYKEKEHGKWDKFLLLIHQECIIIYTILFDTSTTDFQTIQELKSESLVKEFIWAQWDMINQVLYHIHHRRIPVSLVSEDEDTKENKSVRTNPTLSGLQFHTELPHETVLNIPLNLPQLSTSSKCGTYEDDVIPLRVHDCSLDLIVISDSKGMVCVCHHYLYRPVKPQQHVLNSLSESNTVHFAYSVTLLHHSCVIHCVIPGIPWSQAKLIRPTFAIYGHHYIIVLVQGLFTHLLEIGTNHEPCCHILCGPLTVLPSYSSYLVPLLELENNNKGGKKKYDSTSVEGNNTSNFNVNILTIDLPTLDLVQLTISPDFLTEVFRKETSIEVRLGILHYFLCHRNDLDIISELVCTIAEKPRSLEIVRYMQEILIGGSYALVQKNLLADAVPLLALLPVTTMEEYTSFEIKVNDLNITLSHEKLWNTSVMLLSPQQRLIPYRSDLWTKLWDQLSKNNGDKARFKPSKIAEKLLVSLACYQPEALSRSSTPMSPSGGLVVATVSLGDLTSSRNSKLLDSGLPFNETESCTASKQEHIVSVNLRELSMYLLKHGTPTSITHVQGSCTPLHVHAMATRYVAAQLETSRILCQMLCRAASVEPRMEQERGFILVDQLDEIRRWLLFVLLERYRRAIESIAFPAPQGFTSFFTYLGYRTLKYSMFLQYVQRSVFELQVDVSKIIMADISDTKENVIRKLTLLSLLPRSRAKRLLNQWLHPVSFMLRAREHAANILSGEVCQNRGRTLQQKNHHNGLAAFPSADRLSPLDTFLNLLTAKASLAELDFGLLIEATVTSTEDFL
ncbi:gamma-secretase activating protein pigeon isoform X1 [Megachile rotundata]|uniref:gamma-secretase activating protein pigeon isoform X1 n=2 Tax=Megachile rotundata TaxID=143995 RepID=UPI000258F086|nr:PREDICTED: protein pigeon isoform X1 [Megachile rotundata]